MAKVLYTVTILFLGSSALFADNGKPTSPPRNDQSDNQNCQAQCNNQHSDKNTDAYRKCIDDCNKMKTR